MENFNYYRALQMHGRYPAASKLSSATLGLTITNIVYTLLIWTIAVGLLSDYVRVVILVEAGVVT